jgi:hypothetical protein
LILETEKVPITLDEIATKINKVSDSSPPVQSKNRNRRQRNVQINNSCSTIKTEKETLQSTASSSIQVDSSKDIFEGILIEVYILKFN